MSQDPGTDQRQSTKPPPLQFRLRTMLAAAVACALVFGLLRLLGVPPKTGFVVLAILAVTVAAAIGLLVVIAGAASDDENDR